MSFFEGDWVPNYEDPFFLKSRELKKIYLASDPEMVNFELVIKFHFGNNWNPEKLEEIINNWCIHKGTPVVGISEEDKETGQFRLVAIVKGTQSWLL